MAAINLNEDGVKIVHQDIFALPSHYYIAHQCNCMSFVAKGIAEVIFKKYPEANVYQNKHYHGFRSTPGSAELFNTSTHTIINLYGQKTPGKPCQRDTLQMRETYFKMSLQHLTMILSELPRDNNEKYQIAFPYHIGCCRAGGNWSNYYKMINEFAKKNADLVDVVICSLEKIE
jgi:O-acetyl-ADP-ribose deacetylase (regulator of RNase III)